jgi:O-methyltransferase involved in polyketide biosynthesis
LTAFSRATAFLDDEPLLRTPDHLAIRFLDPGLAFLARSALFRTLLRRLYERRFPGGYLYAIARTRYIDQVLQRELEAGTDQSTRQRGVRRPASYPVYLGGRDHVPPVGGGG